MGQSCGLHHSVGDQPKNRIRRMKLSLILASVLLPLAASARADEFAPGPEHDQVAKACTACHVAAQVTAQHKSAEEWCETVNRMISNGAKVRDEDVKEIVAYLAKNYGPFE